MSELGGSNDGTDARSEMDEAMFQYKRCEKMGLTIDHDHRHAHQGPLSDVEVQQKADASYWCRSHELTIESLGGVLLHAAVPVDKIGVQTEKMDDADAEILARVQNQPFRMMIVERTPALYEWHGDGLGPLDEDGKKTNGPPPADGGRV